jgi:hypothetical protein
MSLNNWENVRVVRLSIVDNPPLISVFRALSVEDSFVQFDSFTVPQGITVTTWRSHVVIHLLFNFFEAFFPPVLFSQMITGSLTYHIFMLPIHQVKIKAVLLAAGILGWLFDKPLQVAFTKATKKLYGLPYRRI